MTTRIYLIRHGATILSAEDRFAGSTDVALSDEGREQARLLGERLADEALAAIYASPMQRTVETASLIGEPHPLKPILRPGLREISHGHWEGLTRAEVSARYSEEYSSWEEDPYLCAPEGGETGLSVMSRALPDIRDIVLAHRGQSVAVVSHKATIRLVLCSLLGIDARGYRDRLDSSPACLNVVDFKDPARARLMVYNDTSHYTKAPRSSEARLSRWWDKKS